MGRTTKSPGAGAAQTPLSPRPRLTTQAAPCHGANRVLLLPAVHKQPPARAKASSAFPAACSTPSPAAPDTERPQPVQGAEGSIAELTNSPGSSALLQIPPIFLQLHILHPRARLAFDEECYRWFQRGHLIEKTLGEKSLQGLSVQFSSIFTFSTQGSGWLFMGNVRDGLF